MAITYLLCHTYPNFYYHLKKPLFWPNFATVADSFERLFCIRQNFEPTLANFLCCEWPNFEQLIQPTGYTAQNAKRC